MSAADRVREIVAAALTDPTLVLDGVEVTAAGKRKLVRVTLDRRPDSDADGWAAGPTPALSLDDIAEHSRRISDALDGDDPFGGAAYVLEVSSPGVGRPLRTPRHYQRNVSRLITLVTRGGEPTEVTGRIWRAGPESVAVVVDEGGEPQSFAYADIERASVVVEFTSSNEKDE
ncbi:ribosome maturation factor RimP [Nostocoides sp.]|uniref:ribosome maturation factor RimP n=1 Tax=Nostocoides sp. TaxID=1917966 RepID=UPI002BDB6B91|nr:ribosome maturation factor RimP [Tetrasphaera sp.]